jgi:general nucleoside transport system permease protein
MLADANIRETFVQLFKGAFGSPAAITGTLKEASPLLILGAAVFLALKAGLFNIGAEGQFVVGACVGAITMIAIGGVLGVLVGCLAGAIAGGLWALPAGWIRAYRNGHEVITTIMLNSIAVLLTKWLVSGPFVDAKQGGATTVNLTKNTRLSPLFKSGALEIPQSLLVGLIVIGFVGYWLYRTVNGYELRATGANPTAAKFAGVRTASVQLKAMCMSGTLAGLAGALQVTQFEGRFYDGFSPGYGFDALGVALLSGSSPTGLIVSALFFGALNKGGTSLSILSIDKGITTVILAIVIIIFAAIRYSKKSVNHG